MQSVARRSFRLISLLVVLFCIFAAGKAVYMAVRYEKYVYLLLLLVALSVSVIFLRIARK